MTMARTTNCNFCGKELTKGLFNGTENFLEIGKGYSVSCCDECCAKLEKTAERVRVRLGIKIDNYKKSTKMKVDEKTLVQMFFRYLKEEQDYRVSHLNPKECISAHCFKFTEDGMFSMEEVLKGDVVSEKKRYQRAEKLGACIAEVFDVIPTDGEAFFTKDDITRIEYRLEQTTARGMFTGLYSFEVRLNDEKEITYKPCIVRIEVLAVGLLPFLEKKNAKNTCEYVLRRLQERIGSDLPIMYVKNFR